MIRKSNLRIIERKIRLIEAELRRESDFMEDVDYWSPKQHKFSYFAVLEKGLNRIIWGIGRECEEAMVDAEENVMHWNKYGDFGEQIDISDLECYPCTKAVADKVERQGGDIRWVMVDGVIALSNESHPSF